MNDKSKGNFSNYGNSPSAPRRAFKSALIITVFSLLCKALGMLFRVFMTARLGPEGLGLHGIIMSVYTLFSAFATAGFTPAASRFCAEMCESGNERKAFGCVKVGCKISLLFGFIACAAMFLFTRFFADSVCDSRAKASLYILIFSLPFMAITSVLKGAFFAFRKVTVPASNSLFEQIIKSSVAFFALAVFLKNETDFAVLCAGTVFGVLCGEIASFIYLSCFYFIKIKKGKSEKFDGKTFALTSLTIAGAGYVTSALRTGENLLVPRCLTAHGESLSQALAIFGTVRETVIPLVFFPFAFLSALVSVLMPEISRLNVKTDKKERDFHIRRVLTASFIFAHGAAGAFFCFSDEISMLICKDLHAGIYIRVIAAVTPFMYAETVGTGLLKSIGEQLYSLKASFVDCALRICILLFALPKFGAYGYCAVLVISNCFAFFACMYRFYSVTGVRLPIMKCTVIPLMILPLCKIISRFILRLFADGYEYGAVIGCAAFVTVYGIISVLIFKKRKGDKNVLDFENSSPASGKNRKSNLRIAGKNKIRCPGNTAAGKPAFKPDASDG